MNRPIWKMKKGKNTKALLTGKAEYSIYRNDMFWKSCILDMENFEFFMLRWAGYNDDFWWKNVATKDNTQEVVGDKGTKRRFKLDYQTLEVCEVRDE